ncbi:MAG: endo-1,4-beta-xylanase [Rikenellaceae bacterium]
MRIDGLYRVLLATAMSVVTMSAMAEVTYFDGAQDAESKQVMKQAAKDIDKYRKGNFSVTLVDATSGASVTESAVIELEQHKFEFGVSLYRVADQAAELKRRAYEVTSDIFNKVTICDYFSTWNYSRDDGVVSNEQNLDPAMEHINFAQEHGMGMRFHAVWYNLPMWLDGDGWSEEEFWVMFEERIKYVADHYGDIIDEYDVINETVFWHGDFYKSNPGYPDFNDPEMAKRAFDLARKYLPDHKLVALEASIASTTNETFLRTIKHHKDFIEHGVDYDYVGYQGHFYYQDRDYRDGRSDTGDDCFTMARVSEGLDLLGDLGKPVVITEFNGPSRSNSSVFEGEVDPLWSLSEQENADWQINFYRLAFSKPYIHQITRWFVVDQLGGRGVDAGIITEEGEDHAIYEKLKELIHKEWHTKYRGQSDNGDHVFMGFYGDYIINVDGYQSAKIELYESGDYEIKLEKCVQ